MRENDPYLFSELSSDMTQSCCPIKTVCFQTPIPQHLHHLGILLAVLFEHKLSLVILILVLTPAPILTSLSYSTIIELIVMV